MKSWVFCVCLAASALLFVDNQSSGTNSTGSLQAPYADVTEALLSHQAEDVQVQINGEGAQPYSIYAFGVHRNIWLNCASRVLQIAAPLVVPAGSTVSLVSCALQSTLSSGVLLLTIGALEVANSSLRALRAKGFVLYGVLEVHGSVLESNEDSVVVVKSFGARLRVQQCTIRHNRASVGAVLLLSIANSAPDSETTVLVKDNLIEGNTASLGGSFMYLRVSSGVSLQPTDAGLVLVQDNLFRENSGYLCVLFPQFLNISFASNEYVRHKYVFLLSVLQADVSVSNSSATGLNQFLVLTELIGTVQIAAVNITGVTEGPAFFVYSRAQLDLGLLQLSDLRISNFTLQNIARYSATLFAYGVRVTVRNLYVSDGFSYVAALGCYAYSTVLLAGAKAENLVVAQSATVVFMGSQAAVYDLELRNCTVNVVSFAGAFLSVVKFYNMRMAPGAGSYRSEPARTPVLGSYDSQVTVNGGYFELPALRSTQAFFLWNTQAEIFNVTFPVLCGNLVELYSSSTVHAQYVSVLQGSFPFLVLTSFNTKVTLEDLLLKDVTVHESLFSVVAESNATAARLTLTNVALSSLVIAYRSEVTLSGISLDRIQADTLFWYCSRSTVVVTDMRVSDSTFDLTQFHFGTLLLQLVSFQRIAVRRRFITAHSATVVFDGLDLRELTATSVIPFAELQSSVLAFRNSRLSDLQSREQPLVSAWNSTFALTETRVSDYNVTFFAGDRVTVTIANSVVERGGLRDATQDKVTAGLGDCRNCSVSLTDSVFRDVSGTTGGVLSVGRSSLLALRCLFQLCWAARDGGAVHALTSNIDIRESTFEGNRADRGAGLFFECADAEMCRAQVAFSHFVNNSAREGAGVKWTLVRPLFANITSTGNSAAYGTFEASVATHMTGSSSQVTGAPGVVAEPILIYFRDCINQTVSTDSVSVANIRSQEYEGTTYLLAQGGVANFSSVIVRVSPGTAVLTEVFSPSIAALFPNSTDARYFFVFNARKCEPGEVSSAAGCYRCPKDTFSVKPLESNCQPCPQHATCPGGTALVLNPGYWRESQLSSEVYECPTPSACAGGANSSCAEGYSGWVCSACAADFYLVGSAHCFGCESVGVRVAKGVLCVALVLGVNGVLLWKAVAGSTSARTASALATFKIMRNFVDAFLLMPLLVVDWRGVMAEYVSAMEMLASQSLASVAFECVGCARVRPVVAKALVASVVPLGLLLAVWSVSLAYWCTTRRKAGLFAAWQMSLILGFSCYTYAVKTAVALVACSAVGTEVLWLTEDASLRCWEEEHTRYVLCVFLPMIVLYGFGVPFAYSLSLHRLQRKGKREALTFCVARYKIDAHFWDVVVCVRKLLLLLVLGSLQRVEARIRFIAGLGALHCFLEWHLRYEPHQDILLNRLETCSLCVQFVFMAVSYFFVPSLSLPEERLAVLSYILLAVLLSFLLLSLGAMIVPLVKGKKTTAEQVEVSPPNVPPPSINTSIMLVFPEEAI